MSTKPINEMTCKELLDHICTLQPLELAKILEAGHVKVMTKQGDVAEVTIPAAFFSAITGLLKHHNVSMPIGERGADGSATNPLQQVVDRANATKGMDVAGKIGPVDVDMDDAATG